ncbi:glycogenin glucosyltransferase [Penicillium ochrochloron]
MLSKTVYDELIPVSSLVNGTPANLWLMDRPDLIATFTKIELWRLTQFTKIVYIDCDVVAVRAPDELLKLEVDFAAAPDVGWPDCFNSGLMVLRPNLQDYYALKALAERGISFDGADQGLLNMHFRDWHRLSFTYNCTPSANYQYIPAYKHFQGSISLVHFIGAQKPWTLPRQVVPLESPYNQLLARWWSIYDRHYRPPFVSTPQLASGRGTPGHHGRPLSASSHTPKRVHFEEQPGKTYGGVVTEPQYAQPSEDTPASVHHDAAHTHEVGSAPVSVEQPTSVEQQAQDTTWQQDSGHQEATHDTQQTVQEYTAPVIPVLSAVPQYVRGEEHVSTYIPPLPHTQIPAFQVQRDYHSHYPSSHQQYETSHHPQAEAPPEHHHHPQSQSSGPSIHHPQPVAPPRPMNEPRQPSPAPEPEVPSFEAPRAEWDASRPEAANLHHQTYAMSEDTALFQPPPSYPEAPKNMYYQVPPAKPEPQRVTQLFPWETHAPKPTRIFAPEQPVPQASPPEEPLPVLPGESSSLPEILPLRTPYEPSAETWESYTRSNAWDEDPHIQRYIESIQQARRARTQVISGSSHPSTSTRSSQDLTSSSTTTISGPPSGHRPSIILTDFPTEVERPSLPVTPAPIHRNRGISGDGDGDGDSDEYDASGTAALPAAEGVPSQQDWNPLASLEELRRRQSEVLEHPERLDERLAAVASKPGTYSAE